MTHKVAKKDEGLRKFDIVCANSREWADVRLGPRVGDLELSPQIPRYDKSAGCK